MSNYKEVRAKTGEDRDGKAIWRTIGRVMETKNGPMLKLDTLPLQWDGWAYISDPKPKEDAPARDTRTHGQRKKPLDEQHYSDKSEGYRPSEMDDDIPF